MEWGFARAAWAAFLSLGFASPGIAKIDDAEGAGIAAERLLGRADEDGKAVSYLPFTRELTATGVVTGSLADSMAIAGVPPAAMLGALRALGTAMDLERHVRTGDRFYVRYEQSFTVLGHPIGVGRVLWVELNTKAKGLIAVHRFRPREGEEQFWLPSGQAATAPPIRLPLDAVTVTSRFGMRVDPLDHPPPPAAVTAMFTPAPEPPAAAPAAPPEPTPEERREVNRAFAGFGMGSQVGGARDPFNAGGSSDVDRVMAARRVREAEARRLEQEAAAAKEATSVAPPPPPPPPPAPRKLFMHVGVDLLAPAGAPVYAASDGVVTGAAPNAGYGNWIRINHADRLTTVYGHLSRFAPGLEAGSMVVRGELIGFVGSTGRSTGAHLHFELLSAGRWIDPMGHPATQPHQLGGADLSRFRKQVAASLRERHREAEAAPLAFHRHSAAVR